MKKIIISLATIALIAAGCNPFYDPSQNNRPMESTSTEDPEAAKPDMTTWKTYQNDKLGFKISYPPSYVLVENPTDLPKPENDPAYYKNTILTLDNREANEKTLGIIYIKKEMNSLKNQVAKQFNWFATSLTKTSGDGDVNQYWVFDYFSGSASDSIKSYMLPSTEPRNPGDDGSEVGDMLIAEIHAGYNGNIIPALTTPDWIAKTMEFTK